MNSDTPNDFSSDGDIAADSVPRRWRRKSLAIVLPFLIIGAGVAGASYLINSSPKAVKKPPQKNVPIVQVEPVLFAGQQVVVPAMGTVVPSRRIELKTSVAGEVIWIHPAFAEGGILKAGEIALKIDPKDYELRIIEKEAQVAQAQYALDLESGHQEVALREWGLISKGQSVSPSDRDLALRKPHLQKARAELKAAVAMLEQERQNLGRTVVKAPFNAIVSDRKVDVGSHLAAQSTLATLTGTDQYWIQVSVPVDRLDWIAIPGRKEQPGSNVVIYQGDGSRSSRRWRGRVVRLMGDLDPKGRMARILVAVDDPLNLAGTADAGRPLLMGAYVHAEITSNQIVHAARLPRPIVRENDMVWIMTDDETLAMQPVSIIWRDNESVLINKGIAAGQKVIVSDLAAPVAGMRVRTVDEKASTETAKENKTS